jgi:2-polyprenyl-6-hydroxyphenyl methylase/3-demethylubiquinone-9 3-methyltransferase
MTGSPAPTTIDPAELAKFARMAEAWWDPDGPSRALHRLNPVRLGFIRDLACARFGRDARAGQPLAGLRVVDIGCGGGILSEPLARMGASVVGIDPAPENVEAARLHAAENSLLIDYRATTAEALATTGERFDLVLAMEVVEHVADRGLFLMACADLLRPGGLLVAATINRTPKAYALAIVAAERLLRWLPPGTHDYAKLVRPAELQLALEKAGLAVLDTAGVVFNPLAGGWRRSRDTDVNYMMAATKRDAVTVAEGAP